MRTLARISIVATALAVMACSEADPFAPSVQPGLRADSRGGEPGRPVTFMTRNLYVGADVDAVIGALASPDPTDDLAALQVAIATLQATDYAARARAIAHEIERARPEVIGLQEVYDLHVDLQAIGLPVKIDIDFLSVLQSALAECGLHYTVAGRVRDTQAAPFPGISLVDYDVVLIDASRVSVEGAVTERQYQYNIGPVAPGVDIRRGYIVFNARIDGRAITIANTHLESGSDPQIVQLRAAQAIELATVLGTASPAVVMGDLNDTPGSPMHQVLAGAGLTDTWTALGRGTGLTCCHAADLSNASAAFTQRIDYIWQRGLESAHAGLLGRATLVGEEPRDRVAGPLGLIWPSDHAGLVVQIEPK